MNLSGVIQALIAGNAGSHKDRVRHNLWEPALPAMRPSATPKNQRLQLLSLACKALAMVCTLSSGRPAGSGSAPVLTNSCA